MRIKTLGAILLATAMLTSGLVFNAYRASNIANTYSDTFQLCKTKEQRDFVERVFKDNFPLLTVNEAHDFEVMLEKRAPARNQTKYFGKMDTVIMYQDKMPVGFISYYMLSSYMGRILYLAVEKSHRRKGYARKLITFALESLKNQGAKVIKICTYDFNEVAKKIYTQEFGFIKESQEDQFIFYRKDV